MASAQVRSSRPRAGRVGAAARRPRLSFGVGCRPQHSATSSARPAAAARRSAGSASRRSAPISGCTTAFSFAGSAPACTAAAASAAPALHCRYASTAVSSPAAACSAARAPAAASAAAAAAAPGRAQRVAFSGRLAHPALSLPYPSGAPGPLAPQTLAITQHGGAVLIHNSQRCMSPDHPEPHVARPSQM